MHSLKHMHRHAGSFMQANFALYAHALCAARVDLNAPYFEQHAEKICKSEFMHMFL